jgi:hypothetical protein
MLISVLILWPVPPMAPPDGPHFCYPTISSSRTSAARPPAVAPPDEQRGAAGRVHHHAVGCLLLLGQDPVEGIWAKAGGCVWPAGVLLARGEVILAAGALHGSTRGSSC